MKITRPSLFSAHLTFIQTYGPDDYLPRHETTNALAFADAFAALEYFKEQTPTDEGKEAVEQCARNLRLAFEQFEKDQVLPACRTVQDAAEMFAKARRFIAIDE